MHLPIALITIGLLIMSNVFMTFAWDGHLKFTPSPLVIVVITVGAWFLFAQFGTQS